MTTHTITTDIQTYYQRGGDTEVAYPTLEITFDFIPGRPAYTPRGEYAPIDPPDPAEVEFVSVKVIDADSVDLPQEKIEELAREWLASDEGYRAACKEAEADHSIAREA